MSTIVDVPVDVLWCLLGHMHNRCIISLTIFADTNKFYHKLINMYVLNSIDAELRLTRHVCCNAYALKGYLDLLKEYATRDTLKTSDICRYAAEGGHLEVITWAKTKCCHLHRIRTADVAENRHYEMLKWAIEHGCKRSRKICYILVKQGNLEMLQWAIANSCIYKSFEDIYETALEYGHLHIILWASQYRRRGHLYMRRYRFKGYVYIKPRARVKWPEVDFDKY